ncbi:MAG: TIGR00730 family Rossman fold protein [Clostridia bacterium]|nr:TIGR00730 family Rossman fold protein [Clostridia bacterium]
MRICVFGAASDKICESYIKAVEVMGEKLAKRGHGLVFGAGGNGLMGAAARGVKRAGGEIIGVIPRFFKDEEVEKIFDECTELIFTETMAQRKTKMEELADAFIVVPGGIGTFEEFFEVLTLKQLSRHTKPIAVYDINGYYKNMDAFLEVSYKEQFIREDCRELYCYSDNLDVVFEYIESDKRIQRDVHDLKNG